MAKSAKPRAKRKSGTRRSGRTGKKPKSAPNKGARLIEQRIQALGDWRGRTLADVRRLIREAASDIVEECKWIKPSNPLGVPVWSHNGIICTGEAYKDVVKLTFAKGAKLPDPSRLFNSSLEGNARRAIDIRKDDSLDPRAFKALVQAAIAQNDSSSMKSRSKVKLLSGGNPQIAKGDGDAPVQAYIAAMPGWKRQLGGRLDALIDRVVPHVRKAVKWNSPFYGIEGQGWFATMHVFTRYVKVTFFKGVSLRPVPPGAGKDQDARWIDIYEHDALDEEQMATWVKQAAALPGWSAG